MAESEHEPFDLEPEEPKKDATPPAKARPVREGVPDVRSGGFSKVVEEAKRAADRCPNCGADMSDSDAVICVDCGYDLVKGKLRAVKLGTTEEDEEKPTDLSRPSAFGWKISLGLGAAAIVAAATLAGVNAAGAETAAMDVARAVLRVLVYGPVQLGLGLAAVYMTARMLDVKLGRVDVAAGRMTMAVGFAYLTFQLMHTLGMAPAAQYLLGAALAAVMYYIVIWLTFSLAPKVAGLLGAWHAVMWIAFYVLIFIINWLEATSAPTVAG